MLSSIDGEEQQGRDTGRVVCYVALFYRRAGEKREEEMKCLVLLIVLKGCEIQRGNWYLLALQT